MVLISFYLTINVIVSCLFVEAKYFQESSLRNKKKEIFFDEIKKHRRFLLYLI